MSERQVVVNIWKLGGETERKTEAISYVVDRYLNAGRIETLSFFVTRWPGFSNTVSVIMP